MEGDYFKSDGGKQAQKLVSNQMAAPVPEIMDGHSFMAPELIRHTS
jgi:hypothetical protein